MPRDNAKNNSTAERLSSLESTVAKLSAQLQISEQENGLLKARLTRAETKLEKLGVKLDNQVAHSMKNNFTFNFNKDNEDYKEVKGEDTVTVLKTFLGREMGIPNSKDLYIPVAHRTGATIKGKIRPIHAKLPNQKDKDLVMSHMNRLAKKGHFVTQQLPPVMKERKQLALKEFKALKAKGNKNVRFKQDKLFVDDQLQTQYLKPDPPVYACSEKPCSMSESDSIDLEGSSFRGYAAKLESAEDLDKARCQILTMRDVAASSHIIMAFRMREIDDGTKEEYICENFDSDDDHGMGLAMLEHMQTRELMDYACFVVRNCDPDFSHLGSKRFDILRDVCDEAINRYDET